MARIPKQRVIFDAEKYDLDYLRETRDSYSPMTDAEFEDSISYDMGEDDLRDLMETDWRSNENALDAFLGKSILVRYSPVNCDAVFGTDVCSLDNDDYLNIYVDYDMRTGKVADHLSVIMEYADRDWEFTTYPLDEAEREALLTKMDAYCRHETGKGIAEYAKEVMGEPERPVSLKTAAKESREASSALADNDAHEDIGQDAR